MKVATLLAAALFLPFSCFAGDAVTHWKMDPEKSSIGWTINYGGKYVIGSFPAFAANIMFDPAHLDKSAVSVAVNVTNIQTSDKDAQENLPTKDWFATAQYPTATFTSNQFRRTGDGSYEAIGRLTIRGVAQSQTLPFSLGISGNTAVMEGLAVVKRTAFGIGQGEWAKTNTLVDDVKVSIHIEATATDGAGG